MSPRCVSVKTMGPCVAIRAIRVAGSLLSLYLLICGIIEVNCLATDPPQIPSHDSARVSTHPPDLLNWSEFLNADNQERMLLIGNSVSDILYGIISSDNNITVFQQSGFEAGLTIQRRVFDNGEPRDTWTVVDKIGFGGTIPFLVGAVPLGNSGVTLGFFLGTKDGIEFLDFRQVQKQNYSSIPSADDRKAAIQADPTFLNFLENNSSTSKPGASGQWISSFDAIGNRFKSFLPPGSEKDARFSRLWNFFIFPFHLPLTAQAWSAMEIEEIITYSGHGSIEFGAQVGWTLDPTTLFGLPEAGVSFRTFVKGDFRISVLKKDDHVARVKITRITTQDARLNVGVDGRPSVLDSFIIISQLDNILKVYPFDITLHGAKDQALDITYEYDMNNSAAKAAYENAALGNFKTSEDLALKAGEWRTDLSETGVIRLAIRNVDTHTRDGEDEMKLSFLFNWSHTGEVTDIESKEIFPDRTERAFESVAKNSKEWRFVWNQFEKSQHNFMVKLDRNQQEKNNSLEIPLQVEGRIEDSNTSASELRKYLREIEKNVGASGLLVVSDDVKDYGNTSIYYNVTYTPKQVQKFIDLPEDQMWKELEDVFKIDVGRWSNLFMRFLYFFINGPVSALDLPLSLLQLNLKPGTDLASAERYRKDWKILKGIQDVTQKAEKLSSMFLDPYYSSQYAHLIRKIVGVEEDVKYFLKLTNARVSDIVLENGVPPPEKTTAIDHLLLDLR